EQRLLESFGRGDIRLRGARLDGNGDARSGQRHVRTGQNFSWFKQRIDAGTAKDQDVGSLASLDARDQHRRSAPGNSKPAAILLFECPKQFLGGAAYADAAVNA